MSIQEINLGQYANDGTGDDLRTAFQKVNANFVLLNNNVNISGGLNKGNGTGVFKQRTGANLDFRTLTSLDSSIEITSSADEVNLKGITKLEKDLNPKVVAPIKNGTMVTNPFNLNQNIIINGDVQTTVYGVSVPFLNQLLTLAIASNTLGVNMGTITNPAGVSPQKPKGFDLDFGEFNGPYNFTQNNLDFGSI